MRSTESEGIRNLSLGDLLLRLEEKLQFTVKDGLSEVNDVYVRISPDPDLKFAYTSEAQGTIKYHSREIHFSVLIKQGMPQKVLLDSVGGFDTAQRTAIENQAVTLAFKALSGEPVHEARASVIKYQMLLDLIRLLES